MNKVSFVCSPCWKRKVTDEMGEGSGANRRPAHHLKNKRTTMSRRKKERPVRQPRTDPRRRRLAWLMLFLLIPIAIGLLLTQIPKNRTMEKGFRFTKEGELSFVRPGSGEVYRTIDIEIAEDELEIRRGLMWRREMSDEQGMLFIMDRAEPQSFWMLNTYLALDIIFIDDDRRILNIEQDTQPESLDPIRSQGDARYVLEVVAGFAEQFGVQVGDEVVWQE